MIAEIRELEKSMGIYPLHIDYFKDNPRNYLDWLYEQRLTEHKYSQRWASELGLTS